MSEKKKKITTIEELPGVGDTTAAKLREAGYDSLEVIAVSLPAELAEVIVFMLSRPPKIWLHDVRVEY